jgi:hypothetical protein
MNPPPRYKGGYPAFFGSLVIFVGIIFLTKEVRGAQPPCMFHPFIIPLHCTLTLYPYIVPFHYTLTFYRSVGIQKSVCVCLGSLQRFTPCH